MVNTKQNAKVIKKQERFGFYQMPDFTPAWQLLYLCHADNDNRK